MAHYIPAEHIGSLAGRRALAIASLIGGSYAGPFRHTGFGVGTPTATVKPITSGQAPRREFESQTRRFAIAGIDLEPAIAEGGCHEKELQASGCRPGRGCLGHECAHSRLAARSAREVAVICDVVAERAQDFAAYFHVAEAATDWSAVVARTDIDVIDVCTPSATHFELALGGAGSGQARALREAGGL